jgi:predicted AlkP superfamily pyrophosphatase or phosphodiesterase
MRRLGLFLFAVAAPAVAAEPERPKLVVLVVFDQMRGDYIDRWKPLFGPDGFARLQADGAWFVNCHYPYAITATGPGHASMLTGCGPDVHGIVGNVWYDRRSGAIVNCSESTRYDRVPPVPKDLSPDELKDEWKVKEPKTKADPDSEKPVAATVVTKRAYGTPERTLAPTFGDALKVATRGKARGFGLSFKDRSAVLPVGPKADGCYWLDSTDGKIVTSTFFRDAVHPWVEDLNKRRVADRWFDTTWDRLRPDVDYTKFSGPDLVLGEGKGVRQGVTFPHRIDGGLKRPGRAYYDALYTSPFGNDFLLELVKACVAAEKLGQHDDPDLLTVSFSSNDSVGHAWGPDSQEVLDTTLRSDRMLAELLRFLDEAVGKGKYTLCLTADHGVCPLPEVSAKFGRDAGRVSFKRLMTEAEAHLRERYQRAPGTDPKAGWIEAQTGIWVYLNQKLIASHGLDPADVAKTLADFLARQPGIHRAFTRAELEGPADPADAVARRMRKSYHPDRCGDVSVVLKPYWLDGDSRLSTGTSHGTPHPYDTHVPLLVYGPNVKAGVRKDEVPPAVIAAIFARVLGIAPPGKAEYPVPAGLFDNE